MIKLNIDLGNEQPVIEAWARLFNSAMVGSKCFIDNEVLIPNPYYDEEKKTTIQEIFIGKENENDLILDVSRENLIRES